VTDTFDSSLLDDYHLLSYDTLDSTNDEARRLAEGGGAHGAVIWARSQTHGKGRRGRVWVSDTGNLFMSFLLSPDVPLERLPELSFVAGLAVLDTLEPIVEKQHDITLKWPNDVLLDGAKIAGILAESFETPKDSERAAMRWAVIGVGVNVEHHPKLDVGYPTTDLKQAGVEIISAKIILSRLIHHFVLRYDQWTRDGFAPIRAAWRAHAHLMGEQVRVNREEDMVEGIFKDIDAQGRMMVEHPQHGLFVLGTGDVLADTQQGLIKA
jgi:BirA family biotin operon repressor/biotin-[acetyl-CoA-carboxylase] ligase